MPHRLDELPSVFEKIFIINLEERRDRRAEIAHQLGLIGLSLDHPAVELFPAMKPETKGEFPSIGAYGCFLSHLEIIAQAKSASHESILILEDDADWTRAALSQNGAIITELATTDWHFLHGGLGKDAGARSPEIRLEQLEPGRGLLQTHFIGLRKEGISTAHSYLSAMLERPAGAPEGGPMHVDGAYSWMRKDHPHLKSVLCVPSLAQQRPSLSDITPPSGFKAVPGIRHLLEMARTLRKL